ncbi:MAG: glutamine-hydrolyzing carbamoyl-phosphate synthase small subunit [Verrucomicrobiota bacterium]
MSGFLALEDGSIFRGESFGFDSTVAAEICFNTSLTGYQEMLTDPSYKGQILTLTYPEIGNYGVNEQDVESYCPHVNGLIIRELSPVASNWRCQETLQSYLLRYKIPALKGVDTRALTKKLRQHGAMKGVLSSQDLSEDEAVCMAKDWHGLEGIDYVKEVTSQKIYNWHEKEICNEEWLDDYRLKTLKIDNALPPIKYKIVAYDFGIKYNILRCLRQNGFDVTVVPASTTAEEVLAINPDGIFLSNGPGDPAAVTYAHEAVRSLIGKKPIFGICMGNQILAHALGGKTTKLKFGHRGGNQPVKDLATNRVVITSQNHGFAVDGDSFDEVGVEVSHINLNDGTCEGLQHKELPVFSVQYHPEASPGPHDANYLFKKFSKVIEDFT